VDIESELLAMPSAATIYSITAQMLLFKARRVKTKKIPSRELDFLGYHIPQKICKFFF